MAGRASARRTSSSPSVPDLRRRWSVRDLVRDYGPLVGPTLGLLGVAATLWFNARRADRTGRREIHARAVEAVVAYLQMPYAIRRRRHEPEHASEERTRLTDA